jgi:hypothetical protein
MAIQLVSAWTVQVQSRVVWISTEPAPPLNGKAD